VVLTTAPNDLLRRVHDRMPVLIPDGLEDAWLEATDGPGLRALEPLMGPWDPSAWEAVKLEPATLRPAGPPGGGSQLVGGSFPITAQLSPSLTPVLPSQLGRPEGAPQAVQLNLLDGGSER
jgi:hypothetical protein